MALEKGDQLAARADDLEGRLGLADAIVAARMLAWNEEDPDSSAFWGGVLVLLVQREQSAVR